jgi:DNA repair exonuclease SbcCD nuclease subunit
MATFRFIHTADVHIDSPMMGLSQHAGEVVARIRSATREAFNALIDKAIDENVAFVVIAGDLYDGDWRDVRTGLYFSAQMGRLADAGIRCYIAYGNHDAESQITNRLNLPPTVFMFSPRKPGTFTIKELGVALHGQSFATRAVTDDLAAGYPDPVAGAFNIGVLHTALTGFEGHANYAPCTLEELRAKGYQYWALGHIHRGQVLNERPHVVFPGNLQGRSIRETGPKGAHLVTVEDGEITEFATFHCDVVRWARVQVDVAERESAGDVIERLREAIERAVENEAEGRLLACRVEITGATPLHEALVASQDHLLDEAQSAALGLGPERAWVERVVVSTEAESQAASAADGGSLADVQGWLKEGWKDAELVERMDRDLTDFCNKLPAEVRSATDDPLLRALVDKDHAAVLRGAYPYLMGKLKAQETPS